MCKSNIFDVLKKCENEREKVLFNFITDENISKSIAAHLDKIVHYMPTFDKHNIEHSHAVLKYMDDILGEHVEKLSNVELFLLYMSAIMHDTGMALTTTEDNLMNLCDKVNITKIKELINNHSNSLSYKKLRTWIEKNKEQIYGHLLNNGIYSQNYIFGFTSEEDLINYLADLSKKYIEFSRSKKLWSKGQLSLREDFIRTYHSWFSSINCMNLIKCFNNTSLHNYGKIIVDMLGKICYSHNIEWIEAQNLLNCEKTVLWDNSVPDLVFLAAILRVADYLHFSYDRALVSASYENGNNNNIHWKVKATGILFRIKRENNKLTVCVNAPCKDPEEYYFIKNMIPNIEKEIYNLANCEKTKMLGIDFEKNIDAKGLKSCSNDFIPADNFGIRMQSNNIFKLLMSEELYSDKWACLRELYQNALDACKCINALQNNVCGNIEFGLDNCKKMEEDRSYIYCMDNGIGMNNDIIINYLLNVGNSFYQSEDFYSMFPVNSDVISPVSQFGIGIWSSFMVCDMIEITTKRVSEDPICFTINGEKGYSYYSKSDEDIVSALGEHGTFVKLFLKDSLKSEITDDLMNSKRLCENIFLMSTRDAKINLFAETHEYFEIRIEDNPDFMYKTAQIRNANNNVKNLFVVLKHYIKHTNEDVKVQVRCKKNKKDGKEYELLNINEYDRIDFDKNTLINIIEFNPHDKFLNFLNQYEKCLDRKYITVRTSNCNYYNVLFLPRMGTTNVNSSQLLFSRLFEANKAGFLIDGIYVDYYDVINKTANDLGYYIIDFVGKKRPRLSVDRLHILEISDEIKKEIEELMDEAADAEIKTIIKYLESIPIAYRDSVENEVWKYYFSSRWYMTRNIIKIILQKKYNISWIEIRKYTDKQTLYEFFKADEIHINNNINYRISSSIFKHLISNKIAISKEVKFDSEKIICRCSNAIKPNTFIYNPYFFYHQLIYKKGFFSDTDYEQYDLVNSLFPLINESLFVLLSKNNIGVKKTKEIIQGELIRGFDIQHFFQLDSLCVHNNNIYIRPYLDDDLNIDYTSDKMLDYPSSYRKIEERKNYFVYIFIASSLSDKERQYIEPYKYTDPRFYHGAINGWSILWTESMYNVILPGKQSKEKMLAELSDLYWTDSRYPTYFCDGTEITFDYVKELRKQICELDNES